MKVHKLKDMVKGWFVGDFTPTLVSTGAVEVAVKSYKAGEYEPVHHHKIATEITVITNGSVRMNGTEYASGTIIVLGLIYFLDPIWIRFGFHGKSMKLI